MSDRHSGASPNARFLAGNVPSAGTPRRRIGNALSVSLLTHIAGFLLVFLVLSRLPGGIPAAKVTPETLPHIIWIARPGGPGGGGSGQLMPEPPRQAVLPGRDTLTVPVIRPPRAAPEPAKAPEPEQRIQIPAVMTMAGLQELPGVISSVTPVSITDSQGPGDGGRAGQGKGLGSGPGQDSGWGPGRNGGAGGGVYGMGNGVVSPRLIREIKPGYTPDAMRAKIQGMVMLQAVVLPDGSVGTARVVRSLDSMFGLDEEAVKTVKLWRFSPGTMAGRAVPVLVEIELTFTLR